MGKTELGSVICPAPWNHLCINTGGKNRLCCNATTQGDKFIKDFDTHWNGEFRQEVKQSMLDGEKHDACKICWDREDKGIKSLREHMVEDMKNRDTWDEFADNLDVDLKYPTQLDLKIGNYCNLSCRMCSSFSSSKYAAEFQKIYKDTGIDYGIDEHEKNYVQSKWYDDDKFVEYVYKFIDNGLTHLKFTGGEPLMVPNVKKILQYCIDSGKADNMYFSFITNGTLFSESWMSIFEKFTNKLNVSISIDGVGDTYEYIRYPTDWTDVRAKLAMFGTWDNPRFGDAVRIDLVFTLQIYNMLETKNIVDLARDLGCYAVPITLDKPSYLDVKNAPEQLKTDAIAMLDAIVTRGAEEERFVRDCKRKIMQEPDTPHQKLKEEFVMMSRLKDKYRNQSFDAIEVSKYYE